MDRGWIKLHRRIFENSFLMRDDTAYIVFTKLLLIVGSEKGEWSGGRHQLSEMLGVNPNTLYKALKRLEGEQLIAIESNTRYSVITICKWKSYQQGGNSKKYDSVTAREQRGNSPVTTREHSNKNKNKNKKGVLNVEKNATDGRASRDTVDRVRQDLVEKGVVA